MRRLAFAIAFLAPVAHADELRVRSNGFLTTYVGELVSINPLTKVPNEAGFHASSYTTKPMLGSGTGLPPQPLAWKVYVSIPGEPYATLNCVGNVPAYVGMTFGFDVVCQ